MNETYLSTCVKQYMYNGFRGPKFSTNNKRKGYTNPHVCIGSGAMKALREFHSDMSASYGVGV